MCKFGIHKSLSHVEAWPNKNVHNKLNVILAAIFGIKLVAHIGYIE